MYEAAEVLRLWLNAKGHARSRCWWAWTERASSATSPPPPRPTWTGAPLTRPRRRANGQGYASGPAPPPTWARGALVSSSGSPRPVESVADRQWPDRSQGYQLQSPQLVVAGPVYKLGRVGLEKPTRKQPRQCSRSQMACVHAPRLPSCSRQADRSGAKLRTTRSLPSHASTSSRARRAQRPGVGLPA